MAKVVDGFAYPFPGRAQQGWNFFPAHAELPRYGHYIAKTLGDVAATIPELRKFVHGGAALRQCHFIKFVLLSHVVAFRKPWHWKRTAVMVGLTHYQQFAGQDCRRQMGERFL